MTKAAIYCRISRDPEGLRLGVDRQREDCLSLAARDGYQVSATYTDNDIGASTLTRKSRPQYDAMLAAARRGEFDTIVAYSNSRLTRRLRELLDLIELHDQHGTRIITVVSGKFDLATADGRMVAQIMGSVDQAETERSGERIRRAHLQRARSGATNHGGRPFGWADDKLALHPEEAALIRQAVDQLLDGVPLRAIARDWNTRGVETSRGKAWTHTTLRRLLRRPRLVGWRTHRGEIVTDTAGRQVRGQWEPLLDQDTYDRVQEVLTRDGRGDTRNGARRYLLSGILRCGTCGGRMYGTRTKTGYAYTCSGESASHSVTISGPQTDNAVVRLVKAKLADEDLNDEHPAAGGEFGAGPRLAKIPELIAELMAAFNAGQLSGTVVFGQVEALEAEQARLETERKRFIAATSQPKPVDPATLEDLDDLDRKRATIETVIKALAIGPAARRGEPWSPERLSPPVWV